MMTVAFFTPLYSWAPQLTGSQHVTLASLRWALEATIPHLSENWDQKMKTEFGQIYMDVIVSKQKKKSSESVKCWEGAET